MNSMSHSINSFVDMDDTEKLKNCCMFEPRKLAKFINTIYSLRKDNQYN